MSWARQLIENRLQNARDNLDVLDKNLKRISGKSDASMPNSARRRIGGPTTGQLSVKARLQPPVQSAVGRAPASTRVDVRSRDKDDRKGDGFESEEEAEDSAGAQTLKSNVSVAAKTNEASSKVLSDDTTKQRGRRFFGMLTQTLHSFQEKENEKKPALEKRLEVEKKVEAAERQEKAEAAVERRELFKERMLREEEIAQLNAKMDRAQMLEDWECAMQKTKGNILTNSRPPIFYRPNMFNSRLTELQKRTEKYIDSLIFEREEEMKQELHILPSEENLAAGEDEEGVAKRNKVSNVGGERRLGSNLAGKITNGGGLEAKSAASSLGKPEKGGVVSSEKHALVSGGNICNGGDPNEAPKSLAEELGAPSEDIENLLVEQPSTELPKKESVTTSVASAIIIHTDSSCKNQAEAENLKESPSGSKSDKYSPSKKQRNYRQRSKSTSESRRKHKEASPVRKTSKPDSKKSTADKKESHRRRSERSSSRNKAVKTSDASENSKRKTDNAKEKDKVVKRNRSVERGQTEKTDRSKERKQKTTVAARKQRSKYSSSGSSSSGSSPDEPRKKASRPVNQKQDKLPTSGDTKGTVAPRDSTESKKDGKDADSLKLKNYNTTFASELKKMKQLTEKDPAAVSETSRTDASETIPKLDKTVISNEAAKEIPLPESERPENSQDLESKPNTTPKPQTPQSETVKPKIDTAPVPEYPTHSPLKTPALYKNVNPSLLPVDHENLTFKITSAFQAAPTPPNLPPVYNTLNNVAPVSVTENTDKSAHGTTKSATETAPKPAETIIDLTTDANTLNSSSTSEKKPSAPSHPVSTSAAKDQQLSAAVAAANNSGAVAVKKRRSVSSSSSSSSDSDKSSPGRHSRGDKRKRRSSPTQRRHARRASSRKRRRSHSRRRRRGGSSPRKGASTSRHHRRRPSRERRRKGGSRKRRRSPSADRERRRRKSPSSSSSESSSSGASGNSSDESSK